MPADVAIRRLLGGPPRIKARVAGLLYLLIFIVAPAGASGATPARMIVTLACDTGVAVLFYELFKPVNRNLSALAAIFRLMLVAILAIASLDYFGVVDLFHGAHDASAFDRLDALSLVPFGIHCLLIGYLVFKAGFLPRFLGVLMAIAGLGWLTFASPSLAGHLQPYNLVPGVVGEGALTLWLLVVGLDEKRWLAISARPARADT